MDNLMSEGLNLMGLWDGIRFRIPDLAGYRDWFHVPNLLTNLHQSQLRRQRNLHPVQLPRQPPQVTMKSWQLFLLLYTITATSNLWRRTRIKLRVNRQKAYTHV